MNYAPIDLHFHVATDLLTLRIAEHAGAHFFVRSRKGEATLFCPEGRLNASPPVQVWARKTLREILRKQAKLIFPERLNWWAQQSGLSYQRLAIKATSSRWGSYSGLGNLNLSLYLLLLNSRYVDYTMCHELCHSREMNHGPRFWALLNQLTNGEARQRSNEMRHIVKHWHDEGDARFLLISNR